MPNNCKRKNLNPLATKSSIRKQLKNSTKYAGKKFTPIFLRNPTRKTKIIKNKNPNKSNKKLKNQLLRKIVMTNNWLEKDRKENPASSLSSSVKCSIYQSVGVKNLMNCIQMKRSSSNKFWDKSEMKNIKRQQITGNLAEILTRWVKNNRNWEIQFRYSGV